ncbi:MAG: hypothetical protein JO175_02095 [Candidatus Eremiobacteraeota bacterium]|nr:hypothetical protein [Candidatus Eremiobacteraeota bacterium]
MLSTIAVPPVPLAAILARASVVPPEGTRAFAPRSRPYLRFAVAAAAALVLTCALLPRASLAVFERFVFESGAAADRFFHQHSTWTPPPPPPETLERQLSFERVSLAAAQAKVRFAIVPPVGVPADAALTAIETVPVLVYDKSTKSWAKGSPALSFEYRRSRGREFSLWAEEDDARTGVPPKYMWDAEDLPGGKVSLTKYAHFAWVNGGQMTSATEGDGISAAEIAAIRAAMHGQPVVHTVPETIEKRYGVP